MAAALGVALLSGAFARAASATPAQGGAAAASGVAASPQVLDGAPAPAGSAAAGVVAASPQGVGGAPAPADAALPEIVVTAQRSAAPASKTPVAISVLTGDQLELAGLDSPASLGARLPNVHLDGAADGLRITMRGVSNADTTEKGDPSAAFMLDGIYIARPQLQDVSLFDIARIEVLRGPQGTLYGRNATAGVVNVLSNPPSAQQEGAVSASVGDYAGRKAGAMLNVPVNEALALRAALDWRSHDSYLNNGQGTGFTLGRDRDDLSARLSARLALGADATLLLRYDHSVLRRNNDSIVPVGNFYTQGADGSPQWRAGDTAARLTNTFVPANAPLEQGHGRIASHGLTADLRWKLGPVTLYYLGARREAAQDFLVNYYYQLAPMVAIGVREGFDGQFRQDSHELRVATNGAGPLSAQAGLYYFHEQSQVVATFRDLEPLGLPHYYVFPQGPALARSGAAFGQATYGVGAAWRLTAGLRYSDDQRSRIGATQFQQVANYDPATDLRLLNAAEMNTHRTTGRLGAEFDAAPGTLLFGTVSTGYKAGGFNDGCLAGTSARGIDCPAAVAVPASDLLYQPETLTSYEAGVKARFWHNHASLNATAFYYDYRNLQLSGVVVLQGAPRYMTRNAGAARVKGLEVDGQVSLGSADRVSYALALLNAEYTTYMPDGVHSWAGKSLDRAPPAVLTLGAEHTFAMARGRLQAGVLTRATRSYTISVPSQLLQYAIPGRSESELNLTYRPRDAQWRLLAHVKNIENKVLPIAIDSFGMVVPGDPRTIEVGFDMRF
ncbi:MAG: TonB-dependent receptor [Massilia sp.]